MVGHGRSRPSCTCFPTPRTGGWTLDAAGPYPRGSPRWARPSRPRAPGRARGTRRSSCTTATTASALIARGSVSVAQDRLHDERRVVGRAAPVGEREHVLEADPDLAAAAARRRRAPPRSPAPTPWCRRGARTTARVQRGVDLARHRDRLARRSPSAARRARAGTWQRRSAEPRPSRQRSRARVHTPASIPIPRAASSVGELAPALLGQVERDEVRQLGPARRSAAARASTSPPVIHSPVESEISIPGAAARSARTAAATSAASSDSWPSRVARVGVERRRARGDARSRGLGAARPASAGRPAVAVAVQAGLEDHAPGSARRRRAAPRRSGTSSACRRSGISASAAAKLPTSPPAVESA